MKYLLPASFLFFSVAWASPNQGSVVSGNALIEQSGVGTNINQSSQEAWIDWQSFNIASDEWVHINQLLENGLTVNRVTGDDASEIFGSLTSNGTVYLINTNGILFSETARVDVGNLFATDHWLDQDGTLTPSSNSQGIQVHGELNSRDDLILLAQNISNSGTLNANNISLLGNADALLNLDNSGSVSVVVAGHESSKSWVENTGAIVANGTVFLGSAHKNDWLNQLASDNHVSVSGSITANEIDIQGSAVDLLDAELTAQLIDIESQNKTFIGSSNLNANNGNVRIRGDEIQLYNGTEIDVGTGELTIGGLYQGQSSDHNAEFVHISSTVNLYGNGGLNGNGGEIILWSDGTTSFHGYIEAQGGTQRGDGGFVEVSGKESLVFRGDVSTAATNGEMGDLLLDPLTITIADGDGPNAGEDIDGTVNFADYAAQDITLYEVDLENISALTNITLQADNSIIINDLTDGTLTLNQTGSVNFNVSSSTLGVGGRFEMLDLTDSIDMTGGGNLSISVYGNVAKDTGTGVAPYTAYIAVGDINMTSGGNVGITAGAEGSGTTSDEVIVLLNDITITGDGDVVLSATNTEDTAAESVQMDVGAITITGTGANSIDIDVANNNLASAEGLDVVGAVTLNLNGDINVSGDGTASHTVDITLQEDAAVGGTINNYGDINSSGGDIVISANTMELLDADLRNDISALNVNAVGGDVDLSAFGAGGIDGNTTHSISIETTTVHNLDWNEFTDVDFLIYQTTGSVDIGTDGAKNVSNAELALIDASVNRFTVQTTENITTTSATLNTQLRLIADRDENGSGTISLNGLDTNGANLSLEATDIALTGGSISVGVGDISISSKGDSISVNGAETFNIEALLWDELNNNTGTITLQGLTTGNTLWWENNTLGSDVILDGSGGAGVVFQNGPFTFGGANTLQVIGDTYISDSLSMTNAGSSLDIDGDLFVGSISGGGGDTVTISGVWDTVDLTSIDLIGDAGDLVTFSHTDNTRLTLPAISSANDVDLILNSDQAITLNGADVGDLTVNLDTNSNGVVSFISNGTFNVNNLLVNGTLGGGGGRNDSADIDGTWTINGAADFTNLTDVTFLNNAFTANGNLIVETGTTLSLGTTTTNFALASTTGNVQFDDVTSNRPMTITAAGIISGGYLDAASRAVTLTSDSDTAGDEAITLTNLRAGDLTMNGNFLWNFSPILSGDYVHASGDVQISDATISAFSVDLTSADSVTLSGTSNTLTARSGDVDLLNAADDGSNANLTVNATGSIASTNPNTGTGGLTLNANSDDIGSETATLTAGSGGMLTAAGHTTLVGINTYSNLSATGETVALNSSTLNVAALDTTDWAGVTFAGTTNSIVASSGDIALNNATDGGSNADLILTATGSVSVDSVSTGSGDVTLNADSDVSGNETISVNDSSGSVLTLNTDVALSGTNDFANLVSTDAVTFSSSNTTLNDFDSNDYSSVSFNGSPNTLTVDGGNLILDTPTISSGSTLTMNVGAGSHRLNSINIGAGDININAASGSANQEVTTDGVWTFNDLTVTGVDTFINETDLSTTGVIDITTTDDIVLTDGSTLTADEITLDASDDVTVTGVTATSNQIPSVIIRAGGDVLDGGDTNDDISVFWVDGVEFDVAGDIAPLEYDYGFSPDIADVGTEIASISDDAILTIIDDSESDNPLDSENASVGALPKTRVDMFVPECSGNDKSCRRKNAVRKFLSSLLIGGALPE